MEEYEVKQFEMSWHVLIYERKAGQRSLLGSIEFKYPLPEAQRRAREYVKWMEARDGK